MIVLKRIPAFARLWLLVLCLLFPVSCQSEGGTVSDGSAPPSVSASLSEPESASRPAESTPDLSQPPVSASFSDSQAGESANVPEPEPEPEPEPVPEPEKPAVKNTKLYILMYHHFVEGDGTGCNDWTITTDRFREDLQWLADHGYATVLPSELAQGTPLPEKAVLITLDDGYSSNYQLTFPILKEFNAKAVISMIVSRTEDGDPEFLTWDMCREMAQSGLVEFGSHTYDSHAEDPRGIKRMSGESREEYEARIFPDLQTSIDLIQSNLGTEVLFFAYPHGQTESWADDFLKEHFAVTVTTRHGPANISGGLYKLPRHNITVSQGVSVYLPD